jgi:hypothetical protein
MGQQLRIRRPLQGKKPKKRTKPAPSSYELAKRYFDLQCLRQQVRIAESGQTVRREMTQSVAFALLA